MEISKAVGFEVHSILDFWDEYFSTRLSNIANNIVEKHELRAIMKAKPYDDVEATLREFDGEIYIASMQSKKALNIFMEKHGLKEYFREILSRNDFRNKRDQLKHIIDREKEAEEIIFIDDSIRNLKICRELGVRCILFIRELGMSLLNVIPISKRENIALPPYIPIILFLFLTQSIRRS